LYATPLCSFSKAVILNEVKDLATESGISSTSGTIFGLAQILRQSLRMTSWQGRSFINERDIGGQARLNRVYEIDRTNSGKEFYDE